MTSSAGRPRAGPGPRSAAKGFGVGLALSQSLLTAHGAELRVESALGQGAKFSFYLPAQAPEGR